ncbi:MAG TPA: hypothetical protein VL990_12585, partial [Acidobacteriaceae bacterium]|nr:hypothetical protein [Acidobacteriaceae bacterium]
MGSNRTTGAIAGYAAAVVLCLGTISMAKPAAAQFAGPAVGTTSTVSTTPLSAMNAQYRDVKIRPGDIIAIATYGAPELTTTGS